MFNKLRSRAEEEKGFHPDRASRRDPDHWHSCRDRDSCLPEPEGEGLRLNAKSDARTAQTAEETYFTDNNAYATGATGLSALEALEPTINNAAGASNESLAVAAPATAVYGAGLVGGESASNSFDVTLTSKSGVLYAIVRRSDGTVVRTCNVPAGVNAGGCKTTTGTTGNGTW